MKIIYVSCIHHQNPEKMKEPIFLFPANLLLLFFSISFAIDTLSPSHPLSNGEILLSKSGIFALGFFTPSDSSFWSYLGIRFYNRTDINVVWVANREDPIFDVSGTILILTADSASLQLVSANNQTDVIWSSPSFPNSGPNPIAQLLDTGNLVIRAPSSTSYLWQSFDHPTDTLLPGMKLGPGADHFLTAWKSDSDPSPGRYVLAIDPFGLPQLVIRDDSGRWIWRVGTWNGRKFSGLFNDRIGSISSLNKSFPTQIINLTQEETYFRFGEANSRLTIEPTADITFRCCEPISIAGQIYMNTLDDCEYFSECGTNAICKPTNSPICRCLDGFSPMNPVSWSRGDWSDGCKRVVELDCGANGTDGFMVVNSTRLPDTSGAAAYASLGLEECKRRCLMNCSCRAYASSVGTGCIIWMAEIKDLKFYADQRSQDLYVRISSSRNSSSSPNKFHGLITSLITRSKKKQRWVFVAASVALGLLLIIILMCTLMIRRRKHKNEEQSSSPMNWDRKIMNELDVGKEGGPEISFFKFSHVVSATDNFSDINKLGQGGFGPVYKGRLAAGQEVAIKRLSARSGQGLKEFKNEILLIAKLQHRNLVRLLGCCIYGEEKILIYEFMPNKSLDVFLFDVEQKSKLDWATRFKIIDGIAHGLLYLHKHSRLRIIHRDLKASNILLDADMNPKISDFGLARIFDSNDTEVNTRRIVGTFGYMSPEYAFNGFFSIKSDVFSFGVLLLEIVSGKRNNGFREYDSWCNLLEYAWDLWKKGNWMEIVDSSLDNNFQNDQMERSIYVALLCVQEKPEDRPGISDVITMLGNENLYFNIIKQPAFLTLKNSSNSEWPLNQYVNTSSNGLTISSVKGR